MRRRNTEQVSVASALGVYMREVRLEQEQGWASHGGLECQTKLLGSCLEASEKPCKTFVRGGTWLDLSLKRWGRG